ncbi:MAG: hypothetical protein QM702_00010 [Rubrivivax sp.]
MTDEEQKAAADQAATARIEEEAAARAAAEQQAEAEKAKRAKRKVKARVLVAGDFGAVNDVVLVDPEVAKSTTDLDTSAGAIAYAESLKA